MNPQDLYEEAKKDWLYSTPDEYRKKHTLQSSERSTSISLKPLLAVVALGVLLFLSLGFFSVGVGGGDSSVWLVLIVCLVGVLVMTRYLWCSWRS